jgi:hypothetical protein
MSVYIEHKYGRVVFMETQPDPSGNRSERFRLFEMLPDMAERLIPQLEATITEARDYKRAKAVEALEDKKQQLAKAQEAVAMLQDELKKMDAA